MILTGEGLMMVPTLATNIAFMNFMSTLNNIMQLSDTMSPGSLVEKDLPCTNMRVFVKTLCLYDVMIYTHRYIYIYIHIHTYTVLKTLINKGSPTKGESVGAVEC